MGRMVKIFSFRQNKIDILFLICFELSSALQCVLLTCVQLVIAVILIPHLWYKRLYKQILFSSKFDDGGVLMTS
jgi:hypothetical protein